MLIIDDNHLCCNFCFMFPKQSYPKAFTIMSLYLTSKKNCVQLLLLLKLIELKKFNSGTRVDQPLLYSNMSKPNT